MFFETIFWPLLYALGNTKMRQGIAQRIQQGSHFYFAQTQALRAHLNRYLPDADVESACQELRLVWLIDRSDPFCSFFRFSNAFENDLLCHALPPSDQACLVLSAHRGNGWWVLPVLNSQGKPVHLVSAPLARPQSLRDFLYYPYTFLRWHQMNSLGGAPVIVMRGASQKMREVFRNNGRVIATIDIPPVLAKHCSPVTFFGRTAFMPRQAIDNAIAEGAKLFFSSGDLNPETLKQEIKFTEIDATQGAQIAFQHYANLLELAIKARPGAWHAWGHVDLFYQGEGNDSAPNVG